MLIQNKMGKLNCEFCKSEFSKASNLSKHQANAKYCLKIQAERSADQAILKCTHCGKVLSRIDSLQRHYTGCLEYNVQQRTLILQQQIEQLQNQLFEKNKQLETVEKRMWELTNTSINKAGNKYTHIGQVNIGADAFKTGESPSNAEATQLLETSNATLTELENKVTEPWPIRKVPQIE
jgi:hypothetical protein